MKERREAEMNLQKMLQEDNWVVLERKQMAAKKWETYMGLKNDLSYL